MIRVFLSVEAGAVRIWSSVTDGFYDPKRFPERLLVEVTAGSSAEQQIDHPSGEDVAVVLRIEEGKSPVAKYRLRADVDDVEVLELDALPFEQDGQILSVDHLRSRLKSVRPLPRVRGGYKIIPARVNSDDRFIDFEPGIPVDAKWL